MRYSNFEDLPVWKAAIEFALKLFEFTRNADFRGFGDAKNQLERAGVSISNNIAEGFERGATKELIYFLYVSKGSAGECRSMLRLCESADRFSNFKFEISNLIDRAKNISRQLNGWVESLKDSKITGSRHLTRKDRERKAYEESFKEFDQQMDNFRREHEQMLMRRAAESTRREDKDICHGHELEAMLRLRAEEAAK